MCGAGLLVGSIACSASNAWPRPCTYSEVMRRLGASRELAMRQGWWCCAGAECGGRVQGVQRQCSHSRARCCRPRLQAQLLGAELSGQRTHPDSRSLLAACSSRRGLYGARRCQHILPARARSGVPGWSAPVMLVQ